MFSSTPKKYRRNRVWDKYYSDLKKRKRQTYLDNKRNIIKPEVCAFARLNGNTYWE